MRTVQARSTFRPPPFVSLSLSLSRGTVFALPQHVMLPSRHSPQPLPYHHTYSHTSYQVPPSLVALLENDTFVLSAHTLTNNHKGAAETYVGWRNVTDVNQTTAASVTSTMTSEKPPYYPAGYPSGYSWPHIIFASVIVTVVMLIIVVGNFLVMWAIVRDKNLKGTQNYFIGSLALADFLLGLLIVPFSLANELMGYWYFGTVFCEVWKAMDVLLCTASITSLCLISLDRYWSITKAIHYSRQRTPKRAAVMIFVVWFVSAAICIPPLIGWSQPTADSAYPTCTLSEDIGYVLYSSMGSFYIPAFIMVFVYFKIYQAAKARARKSVSKTPRTTQSEKSDQRHSTESISGNDHHHQHVSQAKQQEVRLQSESNATIVKQQHVVLKQRNNSAQKQVHHHILQDPSTKDTDIRESPSRCQCANEIAADDQPPAVPTDTTTARRELDFRSRSVSLPCRTVVSTELTKLIASTDSESCETLTGGPALNRVERSRSCVNAIPTTATTTTDTDSSVDLVYVRQQSHLSYNTQSPAEFRPKKANTTVDSRGVNVTVRESVAQQDNGTVHHFTILEPKHNGSARKPGKEDEDSGLFGSLRRQWLQQHNGKLGGGKKKGPKKAVRGEDFSSAERHKRKVAKARERRATLVLGLVMAAFIVCWLPFFILYVASAFCDRCIPLMVFTVFFWIGYCNSALNPLIYTVFNRDFRRAFHRILFGRRQGWR